MTDTLTDALGPVRARIAERAASQATVMLPLPEQDGDIVCRFKPVEFRFFDELEAADEKARLQFLVKSCTEVHVRTDEGLVRVEDAQGIPVRFEARLGEMLGLPSIDSALDLVAALFRGNGVALGDFSDTLAGWMRNTSRKLENEALGER